MNDKSKKRCVRSLVGASCGLFFMFFLLLSMPGCAGKPSAVLSSLQMEAIRNNQRGIKAEANGDSLQAVEAFMEALRISRSIENNDGVIVALVNSSRVYRHIGDAKAALAMINSAIPLVVLPSPLFTEVAFEMAQLKLLSGDLDEASQWASKAVVAENGAKLGMRINLLARIFYLKGNLIEAETKVRKALLLNRENNLRGEEANSLRLLGDIQATGKQPTESAKSYSQALVIDKALGKSRKIATDIRGLAHLSLLHNDLDQALGFYKRAFAVSISCGDQSGAAEDLLKMSQIHKQHGEIEHADRLLAERENILRQKAYPKELL